MTSLSKKRKLKQVLAEIKGRGLEIDPEVLDIVRGEQTINWLLDSSGYFVKRDGNQYNAMDMHEGFIHSDALFVGFIAGRGSGKSSAGAQKSLLKIKEGKSGVIMNPDFENFKISTWQELKEWIPWDIVVPNHKHRANPEWFPNQPFVHAFNGTKM